MDNLPRSPEEYRAWWARERPDIPYGYCWCECGQATELATRTVLVRPVFKGEPRRVISGHRTQQAKYRRTRDRDRFNYRAAWHNARPDIPYGLCWCGCGQYTRIAPNTSRWQGSVKGEPQRYIHSHTSLARWPEYEEEDHGYLTPCWIWKRRVNSDGYAALNRNGTQFAARYYYEQANGKIPPGLEPHHLCEVRACVRPDHLLIVSHAQNNRFQARVKLTIGDAQRIRELYKNPNLSYADIAIMFGVTKPTIYKIVKNRTWRS